jgi:AraC-like DNA-binding protein
MARPAPLPSNQATLWREPGFADAELLAAHYPTHRFPPHAHDAFAIGVIERGAQAFLDGDGRRALMPQGTICVINPGQVHEGRPGVDGGWDYRMIYLPADALLARLREASPRFSAALHFPAPVIDDPQTMRLLRAAHLCAQMPDASELEKTSRLAAAVFQLALRHGDGAPREVAPLVLPRAVKRARDYIDAHLVDNPGLEQLAAVAGMSAWHLLRAFRKSLGVPPHAYLVQRRVELAKHMLLRGRPLRQIAIDAGYCDQAHLSREFRRFFGVPPSAIRA